MWSKGLEIYESVHQIEMASLKINEQLFNWNNHYSIGKLRNFEILKWNINIISRIFEGRAVHRWAMEHSRNFYPIPFNFHPFSTFPLLRSAEYQNPWFLSALALTDNTVNSTSRFPFNCHWVSSKFDRFPAAFETQFTA